MKTHQKAQNESGITFSPFLNLEGVIHTPDGRIIFASRSEKTTAEIQFARVGLEWIAEYRFRCGGFHGRTLALSVLSNGKSSLGEAIADSTRRLMIDAEVRCGDESLLNATQRNELAELRAWTKVQIEKHTKPLTGSSFLDVFAGIGGFHQAMTSLGATCAGAVEIDLSMNTNKRRKHAFEAIKDGDLKQLKKLVRNSIEANWTRVGLAWCLLDQAVESQRHDAAYWLLKQGANPNTLFKSDKHITPSKAIGDGMYFGPLSSAIAEGDAEMIKLLLDAGADLSLPTVIETEEGCLITCKDRMSQNPSLAAAVEAHILSTALAGQSNLPSPTPSSSHFSRSL